MINEYRVITDKKSSTNRKEINMTKYDISSLLNISSDSDYMKVLENSYLSINIENSDSIVDHGNNNFVLDNTKTNTKKMEKKESKININQNSSNTITKNNINSQKKNNKITNNNNNNNKGFITIINERNKNGLDYFSSL